MVLVVVAAVAVAVGFVFDLYQVYKIRITWLKYLQQQYIDFVSQMTKLLPKNYFKKGINSHLKTSQNDWDAIFGFQYDQHPIMLG